MVIVIVVSNSHVLQQSIVTVGNYSTGTGSYCSNSHQVLNPTSPGQRELKAVSIQESLPWRLHKLTLQVKGYR